MAAASSICNVIGAYTPTGSATLTLTGVSQLWRSGLSAVDDAEELVVQGLGDGAHGAVADQDAVDRAEVRDLGGGAGEEGLVADVEQLAGQRLLDDLDAELAWRA